MASMTASAEDPMRQECTLVTPSRWRGSDARSGTRPSSAGYSLLDLVARHAASSRDAVTPRAAVGQPDASTVAIAALRSDAALAAIIGNITDPATLIALLGPAARALGDDWLDDRLGFLEVALGVSRLQRALRQHSNNNTVDIRTMPRRVIALWTVPGDTHRFGVVALASLFRARGWFVLDAPLAHPDEVEARLVRTPAALVGFSVGHERALPAFAAAVASARRARVPVLAGGACLSLRPDAFGIADAIATDAARAVATAEGWLATRSRTAISRDVEAAEHLPACLG